MPKTQRMFPHTVDSTILAAFRSCPQKANLSYVEHWKPKTESVHLVAGGAFAKGLEVARKAYFEGEYPVYEDYELLDRDGNPRRAYRVVRANLAEVGNRPDAEAAGMEALLRAYGDFECPSDSAKSPERMAGALDFYFQNYPLGADGADPIRFPDGRRGIEFSFAEPLDILHPVTGDPILYTGRCDMICEYAGGIYIEDDKTTSSLGASWAKQWEMRSQFTGYQWAAQRAGINVQGALVRGVSILKTKYDTQQAVTYRSPHEVDRWYAQVHRDVRRMMQMWDSGEWDFNLDHSCAEYGGCSMVSICKSPSPESWLPMYFERRVWDPLARKEMSVEEFEASWGHDAVRTPQP
jgi:hypothetical protein